MKLAALFSDHAVLQRDRSVLIWGWSSPRDPVTVEFSGQSKTATTGPDGKWAVTLDPLAVSAEPRTLVATSFDTKLVCRIENVLVGDVWLASGQSNMEWSVRESKDSVAEIAAASHPLLRLFLVPTRASGQPSPDIGSAWHVCGPETVETFSAVAYFFGRELQLELGVPIGLIASSKGGTRIEAWTSREALLADPSGREAVEEYEKTLADSDGRRPREGDTEPAAWERAHVPADPGDRGLARGWASDDFDDANWREMTVPCKWQDHGYRFSGVFWFRRAVEVPDAWAGRDLIVGLGACDKHDNTYFNGVPVGAIGWEKHDAWCTPRVYRVPGHLVRAGRNVIATRIYSYMTDGGLIGPSSAMRIQVADDSTSTPIPLAGAWRFQVEHDFGQVQVPAQPYGPGNPNTPHILYDNMIAPLVPLALRGVIWYQGESNAAGPARYRTLFPAMIADWRRAFDQATLPFLFVQLCNHGEPVKEPVQDGWAGLREAQLHTLRVPGTGMAVTIDIGEAKDIHPRNKQDVGRRLARVALAQLYGWPDVPTGPLYRSHQIDGSAIRVTFDCVGGGLDATGGLLQGFAIAGDDGAFVHAEAEISGDEVIVRSRDVPRPVAVRYAWANNPAGCNLYNREGLPASPFRTDLPAAG